MRVVEVGRWPRLRHRTGRAARRGPRSVFRMSSSRSSSRKAKHIEVQLLGDQHGNLVHLYERDCSVQRPASEGHRDRPGLQPRPLSSASRSARRPSRSAAMSAHDERRGTVEFLVDDETEEVLLHRGQPSYSRSNTPSPRLSRAIDLVKSQILDRPRCGARRPRDRYRNQDSIQTLGYAFQCRITTEDPVNKFTPDYGRITALSLGGGLGLRLDGGPGITGGIVTRSTTSLLVKVSTSGRRFRRRGQADGAGASGVPHPRREDEHPVLAQRHRSSRPFLEGRCTTRFIDETPDLFRFPIRQDRATKLLTFAAEVTGQRLPRGHASRQTSPTLPELGPAGRISTTPAAPPKDRGSCSRSSALRPFRQLDPRTDPLLLTDTTFRDAHQSLLATRVRTRDMLRAWPTPTPASARRCSRSRCGARDVRHVDAIPQRRSPGAAAPTPRADPQHPLQGAVEQRAGACA